MKHITIDGVEYTLTPKQQENFIEEIGGKRYFLGPQAPAKMTYDEAKAWCKSLGEGYELPSRLVLLACFYNEKVRKEFKTDTYYWSSAKYGSSSAWFQGFHYGDQNTNYKTDEGYVRAVRVEEQTP